MSGQSPDQLTLRLHCVGVWCWGVQPPTAAICTKYLREIATKHDVAWTPTQTTLSQEEELMQASTSITQPPLTYTTLNPYDPYPGRAEKPVLLRQSFPELTRACVSVLCRVCDWCSAPAHWLLHPHGPRHQLQPPLHLQHTGKPTAQTLHRPARGQAGWNDMVGNVSRYCACVCDRGCLEAQVHRAEGEGVPVGLLQPLRPLVESLGRICITCPSFQR